MERRISSPRCGEYRQLRAGATAERDGLGCGSSRFGTPGRSAVLGRASGWLRDGCSPSPDLHRVADAAALGRFRRRRVRHTDLESAGGRVAPTGLARRRRSRVRRAPVCVPSDLGASSSSGPGFPRLRSVTDVDGNRVPYEWLTGAERHGRVVDVSPGSVQHRACGLLGPSVCRRGRSAGGAAGRHTDRAHRLLRSADRSAEPLTLSRPFDRRDLFARRAREGGRSIHRHRSLQTDQRHVRSLRRGCRDQGGRRTNPGGAPQLRHGRAVRRR